MLRVVGFIESGMFGVKLVCMWRLVEVRLRRL